LGCYGQQFRKIARRCFRIGDEIDMLNVLYKSIFAPLSVINREHIKGRLWASIATVSATAFLGSVIAPVVYYYANRSRYEIRLDVGGMFVGLIVSILTWLVICALFWLMCKAFKKDLSFSQVASTWGLSYIPNFLCVVLYNLLFVVPGINNGSGFAAFIICALFIMFLVWKAIFYFILMRFVIDTTLREIIIITAVSAVVFAVLMIIGFKVGIQVPML